MSDNKINMGFMAELSTELSKDDYSEICDKMYDSGSKIELNYECTLVFSTDVDEYLYDFVGIQIGYKRSKEDFIRRVKEQGLEIDVDTIKPYTCVWYNGADSDMSMYTLEEFRNENTNS